MKKPEDFDTVQAYGQSTSLPVDGYICVVKKMEETTTKIGKPMVKVAIDIADGEYENFFQDLYAKRKKENIDAKYPFGGMCYINCQDQEGKTSRQFKTFCQALEDSGTTISWDDNFVNSITGQKFGVIFRKEETEYNGNTFWQTRPFTFTSSTKIAEGDYTIPEPKELIKQDTDSAFGAEGFSAVEDDIPF